MEKEIELENENTEKSIDVKQENIIIKSEETDPIFISSPAAEITTEDIDNWNNASGGSGASYVAGDNISISDNKINCTIPYETNRNRGVYLGVNLNLGSTVGVVVGRDAANSSNYGVAFGWGAKNPIINTTGNTAIGSQTNTGSYNNATALGYQAVNTKSNQVMLGHNVTEVAMHTADGIKTVATTDLIDALESRIAELESKIN